MERLDGSLDRDERDLSDERYSRWRVLLSSLLLCVERRVVSRLLEERAREVRLPSVVLSLERGRSTVEFSWLERLRDERDTERLPSRVVPSCWRSVR